MRRCHLYTLPFPENRLYSAFLWSDILQTIAITLRSWIDRELRKKPVFCRLCYFSFQLKCIWIWWERTMQKGATVIFLQHGLSFRKIFASKIHGTIGKDERERERENVFLGNPYYNCFGSWVVFFFFTVAGSPLFADILISQMTGHKMTKFYVSLKECHTVALSLSLSLCTFL